MATELRSPSARFLFWLAHAIFNKRRWFFYPQVILALICILFTIKKLEFHTSRNDLVGGEKEYHHIYMEFKKEFPVQDDLVVVVESESMEKNRQFVERLGAKLEVQSNLFASVFYKGDLKSMGSNALFFLPEKDYPFRSCLSFRGAHRPPESPVCKRELLQTGTFSSNPCQRTSLRAGT